MSLVIGICIGLVLGVSTTLHILKKGAIGNLIIVDDPQDGSYMFLEISKADIRELRMQPVVKLNVVDKDKTHK